MKLCAEKVTWEIVWEPDEYHYPTQSCHGSEWSFTVYCLNATAPTVFALVDGVVSALHQTHNALAPLVAQVDTTTQNRDYLQFIQSLIVSFYSDTLSRASH